MNRQKKRSTRVNHLVAFFPLFLMITALCLLASQCKGRNDGVISKKKPPAVKLETAEKRTITRNIDLTGTIEAAKVARIASPAEGPVLNCSIREGDSVKAGQVLLTIGRQRAAEEQAKTAREQLARDKEDLQRIEQLVRSGSIPAEQTDEARLRVSRAKAQLTKALESIEDYQIRSPWAGIVSKVSVTDGSFVSPRESLLEIFDPKTLIIRFDVPEKELNNVHIGMKLSVTLETQENRVFKAAITRLFPELDRKIRTRVVEAAFIEKVEIVPGMFTRISIPIETVDDAVMIPDESIVVTPQGDKVVFVVMDGKAFSRAVSLGVEYNRMVQITEGIKAGDSIIVSGHQKLRDGMEVSVPAHEFSPGSETREESIK